MTTKWRICSLPCCVLQCDEIMLVFLVLFYNLFNRLFIDCLEHQVIILEKKKAKNRSTLIERSSSIVIHKSGSLKRNYDLIWWTFPCIWPKKITVMCHSCGELNKLPSDCYAHTIATKIPSALTNIQSIVKVSQWSNELHIFFNLKRAACSIIWRHLF